MVELVRLRPMTQADDMAQGLRDLADRIEAGDFPASIQTCVVLLGATVLEGPIDEPSSHKVYFNRFDMGPRQDGLTVAGLLSWALMGLKG